ncbi:MAG: hypothetical protein AAF411_32035, partial [Myxococcota bacterium]
MSVPVRRPGAAVGLVLTVVVPPLLLGGATPLTSLLCTLAVASGAALLLHAASAKERVDEVVVIFGAALLWTLVQLVPLPLAWAPESVRAARAVHDSDALSPISLDPAAT